MLLKCFLKLQQGLDGLFGQERVCLRAKRMMLVGLLTVGRHWITRMISAAGRDQQDWSADYRLFSTRKWGLDRVFLHVLRAALALSAESRVFVALDDTGVRRGGRLVKAARWMRDPLSPKFHVNLVRGVRFLHFSLILRPKGAPEFRRGIPIHFELVECVKKPGKKATPEEVATYKEEKKQKNLSASAVKAIKALRMLIDEAGAADKPLIVVGDGSYCNKTIMRATYERTTILARTRKDAALCRPARSGSGKIYGSTKFTPEEIRKSSRVPYKRARFFHGGAQRSLKYKDTANVLWQRGTAGLRMRVLVLAPTGYRCTPKGKLLYRDPAYLLTSDLNTSAEVLIQAYLDRWQIEVNHRDMKDTLGLGDAQVWTDPAVARQPGFVAASYSLLLIAGLKAYGPERTEDYLPLPKWRGKAARPSCLDLVTQLRREAISAHKALEPLGIVIAKNALTLKAAG